MYQLWKLLLAKSPLLCLEAFFCHELIHPPTGFLLKVSEGQDIRLHFTFSMLLADGAAQKQVWSSKGDSGTNVRASGTIEGQMHCNITKYSQLVLTSDAEILQPYAKLDAKKTQCTKAEFDMWQQATGWNHSSKALLLDQDLKSMGQFRPCSQFAHDYMRSILQGVAPMVLYQWLCAMEEGFQEYGLAWRLTSNFGFSQELGSASMLEHISPRRR